MKRGARIQSIPLVMLLCLVMASMTFSSTNDEIATSSNRFGFNLFSELASSVSPDSNICISPLSASYALTMTSNGASGDTREAMLSALELSGLSTELINDSYRKLTSSLSGRDPKLAMEIANSIWYRTGLKVKPAFVKSCIESFDALVEELDFGRPDAPDIINKWAAVQTHDRIKNLIAAPIAPDVVMMLVNAIYFNAPWLEPFDPQQTRTAFFTLPNGSKTECRMMNRFDSYDYYENRQFQAIDIPYGDGSFSMSIFLPRQGISVNDLITSFSANNDHYPFADFKEQNIRFAFPRFKFSCDLGLNDVLKAMGMAPAFSASADFSNIADGRIWIDSVIHKTFIEVNERGTEAAAVSAVMMKKGFVPSMEVNRPFMFVIRERETGAVLFLGRVANPVWINE